MKTRMTVLVFLCLTKLGWSQTLPPDGWYEFPRQAQVLDTDLRDNDGQRIFYKSLITKTDTFILQNEVHITAPLKSNGGDVLIVGNVVQIDAPIDTRIYFESHTPYWSIPTDPQRHAALWPLDFLLTKPLGARRAFDGLYLWGESYDEATKRYLYSLKATEDSAKPSQPFFIPQLPSAPVPLISELEFGGNFDSKRANGGEDAPDKHVIWKAVRSGNIRIFANKISFCDACISATVATDHPAQGDTYDVNRAIFLYTGGLKGGRGGAGSPPWCPFDNVGTTPGSIFASTCGSLNSTQGGLSGKPGRGGDAGDIEIDFVNQPPSLTDSEIIRRLSNAEGGKPPTLYQLRTPPYTYLAPHPDRNSFNAEGSPIANESALTGAEGNILIQTITSDDAINQIYGVLAQAEASNRYSIKALAENAQNNPNIFTVLPTQLLRPLLLSELKNLERQVIRSIRQGQWQGADPANYTALFASISCLRGNYLIDDEALILMRHLCQFQPFENMGLVSSYLFRTGGVFRTVTDVNVGTKHEEIVNQLSHLRELLTKILASLQTQDLRSYDTVTDAQRDQLAGQVKVLMAARDAIQAAADEHNGSAPTFVDSLHSLVDIGKDFATAYAAIITEQWEVAGPALYKGLKGFGDEITNANQFVPVNADTVDISKAIEAAKAVLQDFVTSTSRTREDMIVSQNANLRDLVELRNQFDRQGLDSNYRFDELLRASLQGFLQATFDPHSQLDQNLFIIDSSIAEPQPEFRTLNVELVGNTCSGSAPLDLPTSGPVGCVRLKRSSKTTAVLANSGEFSGLPLAIISPGTGNAVQSFANIVDGGEITLKQFDENPLGWK